MKVESITIKKETELHYQKLMEMIQPGDTLLFMIYGSPDPDAVASAMTLHEILDKKKGLTKSAFVATEPWNRQQNIEFASALRLTIQPLNKIDFKAYRLTVLMDAQPSFSVTNSALSSHRSFLIIIPGKVFGVLPWKISVQHMAPYPV